MAQVLRNQHHYPRNVHSRKLAESLSGHRLHWLLTVNPTWGCGVTSLLLTLGPARTARPLLLRSFCSFVPSCPRWRSPIATIDAQRFFARAASGPSSQLVLLSYLLGWFRHRLNHVGIREVLIQDESSEVTLKLSFLPIWREGKHGGSKGLPPERPKHQSG